MAVAEMSFAGGFGARVNLDNVPQQLPIVRNQPEATVALLFAESNSRFLCEVPRARQAEFEKFMSGLPVACIGEVTAAPRVVIVGDGVRRELTRVWMNLKQPGSARCDFEKVFAHADSECPRTASPRNQLRS